MKPDDLRQRLAALGWSQRDLARVLDVTDGYVSRLLTGSTPITESVIRAVNAAVDAVLAVREAAPRA